MKILIIMRKIKIIKFSIKTKYNNQVNIFLVNLLLILIEKVQINNLISNIAFIKIIMNNINNKRKIKIIIISINNINKKYKIKIIIMNFINKMRKIKIIIILKIINTKNMINKFMINLLLLILIEKVQINNLISKILIINYINNKKNIKYINIKKKIKFINNTKYNNKVMIFLINLFIIQIAKKFNLVKTLIKI